MGTSTDVRAFRIHHHAAAYHGSLETMNIDALGAGEGRSKKRGAVEYIRLASPWIIPGPKGQSLRESNGCSRRQWRSGSIRYRWADTARDQVWQHLASDWKPCHLDRIAIREVTLDQLPEVFERMVTGNSFGRALVRAGTV
jgi:hypothetical protein